MKIIVNGMPHDVEGTISYEDVVRLAVPAHATDLTFSVTFRSAGRQGILSPGKVVVPEPDMVFNCYDTSNA